jgi:hypothetical protein
MSSVMIPRTQRLRELEAVIRKNIEAFVTTGSSLMEIRDDHLFKEAGFATWDAYLKKRVGRDFGIERRQALILIACSQIRSKVPDSSRTRVRENAPAGGEEWSRKELLELGRLAPKSKDHDQRRDYSELRRSDVARVVQKASALAEQTNGGKITVGIVRKAVDEDLGIDRHKKPEDEPIQPGDFVDEFGHKVKEDLTKTTWCYLGEFEGSLEGRLAFMQREIPKEEWQRLKTKHAPAVERLVKALKTVLAYIEQA